MIASRALLPAGLVLALAAAMFFLSGGSARSTGQAAPAVKIGTVVSDCADCPDMVAVPQLGHDAASPGTIFYAGRTEVTWRQYLAAVRDGACPVPVEDVTDKPLDIRNPRISDDYPITRISSDVFRCYLGWLKSKTGRDYRVPSGREWEHLARAGTSTTYYWGDGLGYDNAIIPGYFDVRKLRAELGEATSGFRDDPRFDVKFLDIYPVARLKPNAWGLYDVIGNAAETTAEAVAPLPVCLKTLSTEQCRGFAARGADILRSSNPSKPNPPITASLMTARFRVSAHYGAYRAGYRVVRN